MRHSKYISFLFIFILSSVSMKAQTPLWSSISKDEMAKIFEKMSNSLKNTQSYSMVVTHSSYENYKTNTPFEQSKGYFKKDKNNYHSFLLGIHTIQNTKYKMSVDTSAKVIMVAKNENNSIFDTYQLQDYKDLIDVCSSIKTMDIGTDKQYRLEFKDGYSLSSQEFTVSPDGILKQITLYYAKAVQLDPEDKNSAKVKPRLSISFSEYKKNAAFNYKNEFDESAYFYKSGEKLMLTEKYKHYELSDQRLPTNQ